MVKTKLLIISPSTQRGGVEEYGLTIATAAVKEGWLVDAAFPKLEATQSLIQDFQKAQVCYRPLAIAETTVLLATTLTSLLKTLPNRLLTWFEKPLHFLQVLTCLLFSRPDVAVINLPWPDQGMTSLLACALLQQPTAVVFHLIPSDLKLPPLKLFLYRWLRERRQVWVTISNNSRQLLGKSFHCPIEHIAQIHNGIDLPPIDTSPLEREALRQRVRQSLGLADSSQLLLTIARLAPQKGHDYLIPVIPHLLNQFPKIHFVWVGDGHQKETLEKQLKEYGVSSSVSILGYRRDIPELLQASDLFIFPTYFEGFPFALLEAMSYGLPIVTAEVNGIPEMIEHQVSGLLTRKGDSCDLLEAIRWALNNPDDMAKMARRARLKVNEFSQEKMLDETLTTLSKLSSLSGAENFFESHSGRPERSK